MVKTKDSVITIKVSGKFKAKLKKLASEEGVGLSEFIRQKLEK
jgi:predicted DNA binding CopG/RHH family protein